MDLPVIALTLRENCIIMSMTVIENWLILKGDILK
jgi:hypothetical protein